MPKLITPISYSDKLSVCEQVGQPEIKDEVRQVIDLPLADLQPVDGRPPAVGKFLQGDNQGALLRNGKKKGYENYEVLSPIMKTANGVWLYEFAQNVKLVIAKCAILAGSGNGAWMTSTAVVILDFSIVKYVVCNFKGTKFYYGIYNGISPFITFTLFGFY